MPASIQDLIHRFEEGQNSRVLGYIMALIAVVGLAVLYDATRFRNLETLESMDAAQLARNLSEGKGFTTEFIRPLSIHLVERHHPDHDPLLDSGHPDLANPPLYPLLLAGALKAMPFDYPDLTTQSTFSVYMPDLWITLFNQALLLLLVCLVFRWTRRLFDEAMAWVSAAVLLGAEAVWRFSVSGQSTLLLMVIFVGMAEVLSRLEIASREASPKIGRLFLLAAIAGLLAGLGCLTRYAFGWLIIPLAIWIAFHGGSRRSQLASLAVMVFCLAISPWIGRNWSISGTPFGTAGYSIYQETELYSGDQLERTMEPNFSGLTAQTFLQKFLKIAPQIAQSDLPALGGTWVMALFLTGLLIPFRNITLRRLRYWLLGCLATLFLVQTLGRTELSSELPQIHSENLLVIALPLIVVYGVSLFFTLSQQIPGTGPGGMVSLRVVFVLLASTPLLLTLLSPKVSPVAYPPYYPPWVMAKSQSVDTNGWIMSDLPWAVAWYGHRQSVWLTLKQKSLSADGVSDDFYGVDSRKPVSALYLTGKSLKTIETTDIQRWSMNGEEAGDWASFILGTYINGEVPDGFPLRMAPQGLGQELFLIDSERKPEKAIKP